MPAHPSTTLAAVPPRPGPGGVGILAGALLALALVAPAHAATLLACRTLDLAAPVMSSLKIPAGTLFRDDGRADDPLAQFNGDKWQLRLETILDAEIAPLDECIRVPVRITSDSSVKSVSLGDNRRFVYAGSSQILDALPPSEELMTVKGKVLDTVP